MKYFFLSFTILLSLFTASAASAIAPPPYSVPVLSLKYFPLQGALLDPAITGMTTPLASIEPQVNVAVGLTINNFTSTTKYHGYSNPGAPPSVVYSLVSNLAFYKAMPLSTNAASSPNTWYPDYIDILTNDVNICDYVDNQGVREVWIWGYHSSPSTPGAVPPYTEPIESNMAMGTISSAFWNHGTYGDVSNSFQKDDLPTCTHTYTVYNYNYSRLEQTLHNRGHQIERLLGWVDFFLWQTRFVQPYGNNLVVNSCGWTHVPPNTTTPYDYQNATSLVSNCEDWNPDGPAATKSINCSVWNCAFDGGVAFYKWWQQNIPGIGNTATFGGVPVRNWWEFIGDFDAAIADCKSLTQCFVPNTPPVVNAGPDQTITFPTTTVNINATVTDDGNPNPPGAVNMLWSQVSGPVPAIITPSLIVEDVTITFSVAGTYVFRLTAGDGSPLPLVSDDVQVTVLAAPSPGPTADFSASVVSGTEPLTVTFTDASTPSTGEAITQRDWKFGDGTFDLGNNTSVSHTYSAGTYTVELDVFDTSPGADTETKTNYITVSPMGAPDNPPTGVTVSHSSASSPPQASVLVAYSAAANDDIDLTALMIEHNIGSGWVTIAGCAFSGPTDVTGTCTGNVAGGYLAGTTVQYRSRAVDSAGQQAYSTVGSFTVAAAPGCSGSAGCVASNAICVGAYGGTVVVGGMCPAPSVCCDVAPAVCNNNSICEPGENNTNCPIDCTCGAPNTCEASAATCTGAGGSTVAGTCSGTQVCCNISAPVPTENCTNGIDDDANGWIDCADSFQCSCPSGQACDFTTHTCYTLSALPTAFGFGDPSQAQPFFNLTNAISDFLFTAGLIVGPIFLVLAGVMLITSAGNPNRLLMARRIFLWTIIIFSAVTILKGLTVAFRSIF